MCFLMNCCMQVPVDLVIDHSVQVDVARSENAVQANMELEFQRNKERFGFLKWGSNAFKNMLVVPPGSGIVHQVKELCHCLYNLTKITFYRWITHFNTVGWLLPLIDYLHISTVGSSPLLQP